MLRDLNATIPGAPNFKYYEFVESETAERRGIINIPNERHWNNIELLARHVLQPVRLEFGPLKITSGYRCPELCIAIGSNARSNHARGQASDFKPFYSDIKKIDIIKFIENKLAYRELIAEYFPNGWIHVAYRTNRNIKQLKLKDNTHHFEHVTIDELLKLY